MATKFIITKHNKVKYSLEDAYSGPSCEDANVPYGKFYYNKDEAAKDLGKLQSFNKITPFKIVEVK